MINMYNQVIKDMLSKVSIKDSKIDESQKKYSVNDNFSTIEIYISEDKVSYKVLGDAYIVAMTKWLQNKLINNENIKNITLENLVKTFDLPEMKLRNAVQILELIEKINEV